VTTHEVHEFLWNRTVAGTALIALLCHRTANPGQRLAHLLRRRARTRQTLAGFAGRGGIANFFVAIAHDCHPLLTSGHNV
jgi:hypothetical protein